MHSRPVSSSVKRPRSLDESIAGSPPDLGPTYDTKSPLSRSAPGSPTLVKKHAHFDEAPEALPLNNPRLTNLDEDRNTIDTQTSDTRRISSEPSLNGNHHLQDASIIQDLHGIDKGEDEIDEHDGFFKHGQPSTTDDASIHGLGTTPVIGTHATSRSGSLSATVSSISTILGPLPKSGAECALTRVQVEAHTDSGASLLQAGSPVLDCGSGTCLQSVSSPSGNFRAT